MPSKLPGPGVAGLVIPVLSKACSSETAGAALTAGEVVATIPRPRTDAAKTAPDRR